MKTLAKKDIIETLSIWAQKYEVLSPTQNRAWRLHIRYVPGKNISPSTIKSRRFLPKSVFFPHSEVTFKVENNEYREVVSAKNSACFRNTRLRHDGNSSGIKFYVS